MSDTGSRNERRAMSETATFDCGEPVRVERGRYQADTYYHPTGFHYPHGEVILHVDQDLTVQVMDDGECRVWYDNRRAL